MSLIINTPHKFRIGIFTFCKRWQRWRTFEPYSTKVPIVSDTDYSKVLGYWYEAGISGIVISFYRKVNQHAESH